MAKLCPFFDSAIIAIESITLSCVHDILRTVLRYRADIWYTVSLPYEDVLINF